MNLFIYTGASRLNAAVVESATDLTPVARLPDLIVGDSEPVTVKFLSASGAFESWSGGGTYTLSISIGTLGADGIGAYFQTSSFTAVTNGWTGRLNLASGSLPSVVAGYLAERPGAQSVPLFLQVRVTDADGNSETYARQAVAISGAVSVPTTANSTPVTYATAADVSADASTASAAAIAAAASASTAAGSASTAAGHVATAGNSATAAAASAVTAGNSATTAAGSATTATTQATNAATSSSDASTYKDAAAVSAASATSSAGTATTQAALATTNGAAQVTLAAAQVTLATTQAGNAATSATAAGVSAAAALASEAAALVSKNAAAASAASASAVSGSGNGTFSAAALTGVTSVTAPAATALTLAGGSTGASLVLGQGASGIITLTPNGGYVSLANAKYLRLPYDGTKRWDIGADFFSTAGELLFAYNGVTQASFKPTGNLLIGTTTDIAGTGGLHVAGTAAATTTTSGALRVAGGVGVVGAIYNGSNIVSTGSFITSATGAALQLTGSSPSIEIGAAGSANSPLIDFHSSASSTDYDARIVASGGTGSAGAGTLSFTAATINIPGTTSASSSTVGALTIGNGTAATNVAIGGGNVNAGGTIAAGGNMAASAASAGAVSIAVRNTTAGTAAYSALLVGNDALSNIGAAYALSSAYTPSAQYLANQFMLESSAAGGLGLSAASGGAIRFYTGTINRFTIDSTGAATFAGAVTVSSSTASTNTTSGALVVTGGVGVGGAMNVGGGIISGGGVTSGALGTFRSAGAATSAGSTKAASAIVVTDNQTANTDSSLAFGINGTTAYIQSLYTTVSSALAINPYGGATNFGAGAATFAGDVKIGSAAAPTYGTAGKLYVYGGPARLNLNGADSTWIKGLTLTPTGDNFRHVHQYAWSNTGNSVATKWVKEINGTESDMMVLTDGNLAVNGTGTSTFAGAVSLSTAGTTVSIKSGANAAAGTVTLVGGTATITSTAIDVNTVIVMSVKTSGGTIGDHTPSVKVNAGNAVITGSSSDTSTYNWVALKVN